MQRHLPLMAFAAVVLLAVAPGCKKKSIINPEPDPPVFLKDPIVSQDTTQSNLGIVRLRFSWETDRKSADVFYYGATVDSMTDSVVAQNSDTPGPGGTMLHLHQAPTAALAPLSFDIHYPFFYRIRAKGTNGESGLTVAYRYIYPY